LGGICVQTYEIMPGSEGSVKMGYEGELVQDNSLGSQCKRNSPPWALGRGPKREDNCVPIMSRHADTVMVYLSRVNFNVTL